MLNVAPRYFSTNAAVFGTPDLEERVAKGQLQTVDLAEAIIAGQAPDGGLYMPTHFPQISLEAISRMRDMSYAQVFVEVIKDFFQDVLSESTLERIAHDAYEGDSPFEPLVEPLSDIDHIGRLDEGPTFAFKDYAAQVLFRFMEALMEERPKTPMIIVTAASPKIPEPLVGQLKDGGKMLIPIGDYLFGQELDLITKVKGKIKEEFVTGVVFVPLIGKYGASEPPSP